MNDTVQKQVNKVLRASNPEPDRQRERRQAVVERWRQRGTREKTTTLRWFG